MRTRIFSLIFTLALLSPAAVALQDAPSKSGQQLSTDQIIQRFAAAESANKIARNNYTFTQDVDIMTIGEAGSITGRFRRVSDIVYDDRSNRIERITYFPPHTLRAVTITQEDLNDLAGVQPFALTLEDLPKYDVAYKGKERIDELDLYVFEVKPKRFEKGERYFQGKVWVDDRDLQIVKVAGKGVPEIGNNRYPNFESYRENIDGRYWFPTYVYADDVLEFETGPVHIRMIVRYTKYKEFTTGIRLVDEGEVAGDEGAKQDEKKKKPEENDPATKKPEENKTEPKKPVRKPDSDPAPLM